MAESERVAGSSPLERIQRAAEAARQRGRRGRREPSPEQRQPPAPGGAAEPQPAGASGGDPPAGLEPALCEPEEGSASPDGPPTKGRHLDVRG